MILNGSFLISPEATLVILCLELGLFLIPEDANSLEPSASVWMEGNRNSSEVKDVLFFVAGSLL